MDDKYKELANKLFSVNQNGQVEKLLKDEIVINPLNPHLKANIEKLQELLKSPDNKPDINEALNKLQSAFENAAKKKNDEE